MKWITRLEHYFPFFHRDLSKTPNRDLRDEGDKKTRVRRVIVGVCAYNLDTGELENFATWNQEQTFNANIRISDGSQIIFEDDDCYIERVGDNDLRVYIGGNFVLQFTPYQFQMQKDNDMAGNGILNTSNIRFDETNGFGALAGHVKLYAKAKGATNALYFRTDDGTEHEIASV